MLPSFIGALSITPISWDLGVTVQDAGIQTLTITALNDTDSVVKVDFLSTCDCLYSSINTLTLSPEESSQLQFFFDPKDENGSVSKLMIIRTTQPDLPKALFEVHGEVLGKIEESGLNATGIKSDSENDDLVSNEVHIFIFYFIISVL